MLRVTGERFGCGSGAFPGWRARLPIARGIATPCLTQGRMIFGAGFGSHEIYAVSADDGQRAWRLHTKDDGPTAVTALGGLGFANTESCTLEAFDIETGNLRWENWLGDPLLAQPAAYGNRVFMAYPRERQHWLAAFSAETGVRLWARSIGHDVITAPICEGPNVYVATYDGTVTCLDALSGHLRWRKALHATAAPWVFGDDVYVSQRGDGRAPHDRTSFDGSASSGIQLGERVASIRVRDGAGAAVTAAKHAVYLDRRWGVARKTAFACTDAEVGFAAAPASAKMHVVADLIGEDRVSRTWRYQGSRPVVRDGVLYETTGDRLEARDLATDRLLWTWADAGSEAGERKLTPAAVANGRVLLGTWDGRIVSLDAASGHVRWDVSVGAPCHWQPVMSGGRVAAGLEDGSVVSFATRDSGDDCWPMWGGGPGHNGI